jgi:hypothetical protein
MSEEKTLEEIRNELKEIKEEVEGIRKEMRGLRKGIEELIKVVKPLQYFYGGMWGALLWTITVIILFGLAFTAMGKPMPWIQGFGLGLGTGLIATVLAIIWAIITIKTSTSPSRDNKDVEEEESD